MPSTDERNKRLDALTAATVSWSDKRAKEYADKVAVVKKILKGRTGSERLASATASAASDLVVDEIDAFLVTS